MLESLAPRRRRARRAWCVLTPGIYNSAYFEHCFLAQQMGVELVEGATSSCRTATSTCARPRDFERVDVIYRRIDDDFLDPEAFRADSLLGVPGLMDVYRAGRVALANAPGTGVADDKVIYAYVPEMIKLLPGRGPDPAERADVPLLARRGPRSTSWRISTSWWSSRPTSPAATACWSARTRRSEQRAEFAGADRGQPAQLHRAADAGAVARADDRRTTTSRAGTSTCGPYILYGKEIYVLPGGLTRVALRKGSLVVNSSQGGGSKDTWVLADEPSGEASAVERRAMHAASQSTAEPRRRLGLLDEPLHRARGERRALHRRESQPMLDLPRRLRRAVAAARRHHRRPRGFAKRYGAATQENVIQFLTFDPENPNSIRSCLRAARENARSVREIISSEMWEQINSFYLMVTASAARRSRDRCPTFCPRRSGWPATCSRASPTPR